MSIPNEFVWFYTSLSAMVWFSIWFIIILDFLLLGRRLSLWAFVLSTVGVFLSFGPGLLQGLNFLLWIFLLGLTYRKSNPNYHIDSIITQKSHEILHWIVLSHSVLILTSIYFLGLEAFILQDYVFQIFQEDRWALIVRLALFFGLTTFSLYKIKTKLSLASFIASFITITVVLFGVWNIYFLGEQNVFVRLPVYSTSSILAILAAAFKNLFLLFCFTFILLGRKASSLRQNIFLLKPSKIFPIAAGSIGIIFLSILTWFVVCGIQAWIIFQNRPLPPVSNYKVKAEFIQFIVAQEDPWFFYHNGVGWNNMEAIINANFQMRRLVFGGSTITMQLAKLHYLNSEKTFTRKFRQMWVAWFLEHHFKKEDILKYYLESIDFGLSQKGIEFASQTFYQKKPHELTVEEEYYLGRGIAHIKNVSPNLKDNGRPQQKIVLFHDKWKWMLKYIEPHVDQLSFVQE